MHPTPLPLSYDTPSSTPAWWPVVRMALIAWSALGIVRAFVANSGTAPGSSLMALPALIELLACLGLLLGAIVATSTASTNTLLTIGAAGVILQAGVRLFFGPASPRGSSFAATSLAAIQHTMLPVALVWLKLKFTSPRPDAEPMQRLGAPGALLAAAQLPGAAGMGLLVALLSGALGGDPFGATILVTLIATVAGSILSAGLSLTFLRTSHGERARALAKTHAFYLLLVIGTVVVMIMTAKPPVIPGGGF